MQLRELFCDEGLKAADTFIALGLSMCNRRFSLEILE